MTALKTLPVPALEDTLAALRTVVSAVASGSELNEAERAIANFASSPGPRLQEKLLDVAHTTDAQGSSWLTKRWLRDYLTVREPLPLSTNVGFQVAVETPGAGSSTARAAAVIAKAAQVHLAQAAGTQPEERDFRGNLIDPAQWQCLNGGLRHPEESVDTIRRCELGPENRFIGVLWRGRMWQVPVSDEAGNALSPAAIRDALDAITAEDTPGTFAHMSYLGSGALAEPLARLLEDPHNAATYQELSDQLFSVSLVSAAASDDEHQRATAFEQGLAWVYKPITYVLSLADDYAGIHVEHATVDGATLSAMVKRIQEASLSDASRAEATSPTELTWTGVPESLSQAPEGVTPELHTVKVARVPVAELTRKFSADAMGQFILMAAQQLTFGRIRSHYEAVDMREYKAGRTECLRSVTPEAVALVRALVAGEQETDELLDAALKAHSAWVKRCKSGQGTERHLWALGWVGADSMDAEAAAQFLATPAIRAAREDFLSTSSVGTDAQIVRFSFAPTCPGGFGVNYTPGPEEIEFHVSFVPGHTEEPQEFLENLHAAGKLVADMLRK